MTTPTIAVLGGGYAGLFAAHRAVRAVTATRPGAARVVLVDAGDAWEERTRWHQLATGQPIRASRRDRIFTGTAVDTVRGEVTGIDLGARTLSFADDRPPLSFDRLVYTPGSRSSAHSVPGALENSHTLDSADSSRRLAHALEEHPTGRVLVVGGGLTGVQTAAATAQRYPEATVTLLSSAEIGPELPERARRYVRTSLGRLGVELETGHRVDSVRPGRVLWDGGERQADLVVWTAGFTPSDLARRAGLEVTDAGQAVVDAALRSRSHPFVFAAGDGAAVPRAASAYGAYAATATGATAGTNAALDLGAKGVAPLDMSYFFIGASLGSQDAVVQLLRPDGSPRSQLLTGRKAHWLKEAVEHYVSFAVRTERRVPGLYHWSPAPKP